MRRWLNGYRVAVPALKEAAYAQVKVGFCKPM